MAGIRGKHKPEPMIEGKKVMPVALHTRDNSLSWELHLDDGLSREIRYW